VNGITPDLLVKSPGSVAAFERRYRIYFHRDLTAFPEFLLHAQGAKPDQPASTAPDNKRRVEEDTP